VSPWGKQNQLECSLPLLALAKVVDASLVQRNHSAAEPGLRRFDLPPKATKIDDAEHWTKDGKEVAVEITLLSCQRFPANEVRLWLSDD